MTLSQPEQSKAQSSDESEFTFSDFARFTVSLVSEEINPDTKEKRSEFASVVESSRRMMAIVRALNADARQQGLKVSKHKKTTPGNLAYLYLNPDTKATVSTLTVNPIA